MRRKLVWLNSAVDDIARLREFTEEHNPKAAKKAAQTIKTTANKLIQHPYIGKPVDGLLEYRDIGIRFGAAGYILRYRFDDEDNTIYIIHVKHYRESGFK